METSLHAAIALCRHCDSPIPSARQGEFCCNGCETVFHLLMDSGLGEYYSLKDGAVCYQTPKPVSMVKQRFDFVTSTSNVKFYLEGIHCSACLWLIERLPAVMPDAVRSCSLNLSTSVLSVSLQSADQVNEVASQIQEWGYLPHLVSENDSTQERIAKENKKRLLDVGIAGALAGNVMLMSIPLYSGATGSTERLFEILSALLAVPALFFSGRVFFKNVYSGVKARVFPIDAPILLALLVAFFYSFYSLVHQTHQLYFDSLTALIFLLLSSRYYLARLRQSSQMSLGVLSFFQAEYSGKTGDHEILHPGEKVRFDGVVRQGEGWCDYSQFTGESEPVKVQAGDPIYAGTVFLGSSEHVVVEVQKTGVNTRLAQLLQKVSEVQSKRTKTELVSDRWSQLLLVVVTNVALMSGILFLSSGKLSTGIERILALLIVTCPCALALATPLVFTLAMKSLLKKGVLIKDPVSLDQLPEVKRVYFDKTGTLTVGHLDAEADWENLTSQDLSALYSMVRLSRHPVSRAIERSFAERKMMPMILQWNSFEEKLGNGLKAVLNQDQYSLSRSQQSRTDFTESSFSKNGVEILRIILRDHTRLESRKVVSELQKSGVSVCILSGDQDQPVRKLADELGVNQYFSASGPEEKARIAVDEMMVGDGVNDALALSGAKVSVAVQGGMEAAIQSAQVFSLKPGVSAVLPLFQMAHRVRRTLRQNFILSTSYNLIGAVLALSGNMSPLIAAVLMPASALTVFWSSMVRMKDGET